MSPDVGGNEEPPKLTCRLSGAGALVSAGLAAACLAGCWSPPLARLPADARPGALGKTIVVITTVRAAKVESVGCKAHTVTLSAPDVQPGTYAIGPHVTGWKTLRGGDEIDARVKIALTVYVPPKTDGHLTPHPPLARVLDFEPSYRLLTLQYANGETETFKVSLSAHLRAIMPGSWVDIRPIEALALHVRRTGGGNMGACLLSRAAPAP